VLQLIGDTDVAMPQLAALALHRAMSSSGLEVRTLALCPGRRGGLEQDVPAVAPGRRSFAARGQVVHESRWADVVVLHAPRALTAATLPSRRSGPVPVVVAVWEAPPDRRASGWTAEARLVRGADRVVVPSPEVAGAVQRRYSRGDGVVVLSADLTDPGRPVPDGPAWARLLAEVVR
jgi:hypothetical protein